MPARTSWEIVERSTERLSTSVAGTRWPLTVTFENWGESPRMTTFWPSPASRWTLTPGSRPIDSATLASGTSWMRSAETTLTMVLDEICWLIAAACPAAWAVTTTSWPPTTA